MTKVKTKARKALLKRIRITDKGKIMHRPIHQGHFNAKESGNKTRAKRKMKNVAQVDNKKIKKILPNR
jgi:ribosomal protein L35